jgi:hypothetical protein
VSYFGKGITSLDLMGTLRSLMIAVKLFCPVTHIMSPKIFIGYNANQLNRLNMHQSLSQTILQTMTYGISG